MMLNDTTRTDDGINEGNNTVNNNNTNVTIKAPNMQTAVFKIVGTAPLMTARFSKKADLMAKMAEGKSAASKRNRPARDFEQDAEDAAYRTLEGWYGVNAASFRNAMISACRLVGFKMTLAKLSVFVEAEGFDERDATPLVRIDAPHYEVNTMHVRNATGVVDVRARPLWRPGWKANLTIRWDADQFSVTDIANLLSRVGLQVGVGEGRPDSKSSAGLGFGLFKLAE
jgi:hypothetical protein